MAEFEDDYPVLDLSAKPATQSAASEPADDYPVLDPATIHGSNVPRPPEDDYPVLNQEQAPRGVQTRATEAFQDAYKPVLGKAVEELAPDFTEKHPIISNVLQGVISGTPLGAVDKLIAAGMALPSAAAGAVAGLAEKNPKAAFPIGLSRMEADRLQRDIDVWGKAAMFESGMGTAGALSHGRGVQIGDVGREGLRDLRKQGQTPGSTAAPGVAQEPNPPAALPVADAQNKATLGTGELEKGGEDLNTRDYGKTTPAATGDATGVNVIPDGVDPTIASTFKPAQEVAPATTPAAAPPPVRSNQVPTAEQAAAAQERIAGRRGVAAPLRDQPGLPLQAETPTDLDHASANRLVNQRQLLNTEAAKRGVTPEVLKQQAYDVLNRERATPAPEQLAPVPAGTVELPPVEVRPAEAVVPETVAARRPFEPSPEALAERVDPGVAPTTAGAAAAPPPAPPPASVTQRARTHISDTLRTAYDKFLDIGGKLISEVQMHVAPMATGKDTARAMVKDHADAMRRIDYEWTAADDHIQKHFTPEQQKRMWDAADEENVMRQRGEASEHMGIATLEPNERALVESFQVKARDLWQRAREIGWVEGEGLPYYTPRMISNIVERGGGPRALDQYRSEITTSTPQMKRRKYMEAEETEAAAKKAFGEEAELVRNIRTMPLVLAKMEKALAGRALINKIREAGRAAGENTVMEGGKPNEPGWFTIPENPAFYTNRPRMEVADTPIYRERVGSHGVVEVPNAQIPLLDRNGNPVMDRVPLWVRGDFEGPLRSIMHRPSGMLYSGFMALKGKTMGLIMNSPAIHNAVEWGRALPTMPGKMLTFQVYFEGNAAKRGVPYNGTARYVTDWATGKLEQAPRNASPTMIEAINAGMMPIGKRFFMQDLTGILEQPNLTPGRSFTAKVLGAVPDLFDPRAGDVVKRAIDRAGDFWHNTLLWDRIGDLQAGIYVNAKKDLLGHGVDELSAQRVAAHVANRYAGALPQEAMSSASRKIANVMMFSRSFTLGNLGVMKDMVTGLPRDVKAQITRDIGSIDPKAADYVKSLARRKAMGIVAIDVGLMYVGNSLLQSAFNLLQDDNTLSKEAQGYVRRFSDAMQRIHEDPLSLMQPLTMLESLSSTYENEPDKHDRIMVGKNKDGRALYMRNPVGKIGEEFVGYVSKPIKQMLAKMSTMARPGWQILANDKGFGQKIYDPNAETIPGYLLDVLYPIVKQMVTAQTPEGQIKALKDLLAGENVQKVGGVPVNALQAFGPLAGFTFSPGHPGGPAAGELARFNEIQKFKLGPELTAIRKLVTDGKTDEAIDRIDKLELDPNQRKQLLNPRMSVRGIRDLYRHATPAQLERFERKRE